MQNPFPVLKDSKGALDKLVTHHRVSGYWHAKKTAICKRTQSQIEN